MDKHKLIPYQEALANIPAKDSLDVPYIYPQLFSDEECDKIITLSKHLPKEDSRVGSDSDYQLRSKIRDSNVKWMTIGPDTQWVFERLRDAIHKANQLYLMDILGCHDLQVTEYGPGGHYRWHMDIGKESLSKRKLSITVQLSKPGDYEGGALEFMGEYEQASIKGKQRGTATIFPSFMTHRVSPVTQGKRWALVVWIYGPPFR